jgi:hypothetical protein
VNLPSSKADIFLQAIEDRGSSFIARHIKALYPKEIFGLEEFLINGHFDNLESFFGGFKDTSENIF